jgi:hypothetical protein
MPKDGYAGFTGLTPALFAITSAWVAVIATILASSWNTTRPCPASPDTSCQDPRERRQVERAARHDRSGRVRRGIRIAPRVPPRYTRRAGGGIAAVFVTNAGHRGDDSR